MRKMYVEDNRSPFRIPVLIPDDFVLHVPMNIVTPSDVLVIRCSPTLPKTAPVICVGLRFGSREVTIAEGYTTRGVPVLGSNKVTESGIRIELGGALQSINLL